MGINNINPYIINYNNKYMEQPIIEDNGRIYTYRSLIIDLSNKVLNKFRHRKWHNDEYKEMINYIKSDIKCLLDNIYGNYDEILLFLDIKEFNVSIHDVTFSEHILRLFTKTKYNTKKFKVRSMLFLPNDIVPSMQNIVEYGRCKFEIKSIYGNYIKDYSNVNWLTDDIELQQFAYIYGILRSLLYHGKHSFMIKDDWQLTMSKTKNHEDFEKNFGLIRPVVIYLLYHNILQFTETYKNVKIILSNFEADFSIFHYINIYPNTRRIVNSNDSDFLLINDSNILLYYNNHLINTKKFWYSVFGEYLDTKVIKIIAVLLGTSHNPYSDKSPIHIKSVNVLLKLFSVEKYSDITVKMLLEYIDIKCKNYQESIYCFETLIALNVYIHDYEDRINEYNPKKFKVLTDVEIREVIKNMNTSVFDLL